MRKKARTAGRPLLFEDVNDFEEQINAYFATADKNKTPYTYHSLLDHMKLSEKVFNDYGKRKKFDKVVEMARQKLLAYAERYLFSGKNAAGAIMLLKVQYGWKDKTEIDAKLQGKFSLSDLFEKAVSKDKLEFPTEE